MVNLSHLAPRGGILDSQLCHGPRKASAWRLDLLFAEPRFPVVPVALWQLGGHCNSPVAALVQLFLPSRRNEGAIFDCFRFRLVPSDVSHCEGDFDPALEVLKWLVSPPWTVLPSCPCDVSLTWWFPQVPRHLAGQKPHPASAAVLEPQACCHSPRHHKVGPTSNGTVHPSSTSWWPPKPGAGSGTSTCLFVSSLRAGPGCLPASSCPSRGFLSSRKGSWCYLVPLDACPPLPWQGQPSSPHAVAAATSHTLHLCRGHGVSCCLQAHPSVCRVVLTLPFCLLFTVFQICPFQFSPRCCLQGRSSSRMVPGLADRMSPLWAGSSLASAGLEKAHVVSSPAGWQCHIESPSLVPAQVTTIPTVQPGDGLA